MAKLKVFLRAAGKWLLLALALTALFTALMTCAYAIPDRWIEKNVEMSLDLLEDAGDFPLMFVNRNGSYMDHFTDKIMLRVALREPGTSPLQAGQVPQYARYWHGYQIYLRPLLVLGPLGALRGVSVLVHFVLLSLFISLVAKKMHLIYAVCFSVALALTGFLLVPLSAQFSSVYLVAFSASIVLLLFHDKKWFRSRLLYFFFIVGAFTSFVDLLTAPVITLGIPLILVSLLQINEDTGIRQSAKKMLGIAVPSIVWGAGYVSLWLSKWVISSAILRHNVLRNAFSAIFFRAGLSATAEVGYDPDGLLTETWAGFESFNRFEAVKTSFLTFLNLKEMILFLAVLCAACLAVCLLSKTARGKIFRVMPLLPTLLIPFVWMAALGQHTFMHTHLVYRNWIVFVFALMCVPAYLILEAARNLPFTQPLPPPPVSPPGESPPHA
ncbi:MAG: hypothetical protein FWH26_05515 [Oscillospiraceae bacterium]|nr:hypothetical protein [Oscillospiraceae bacterium]